MKILAVILFLGIMLSSCGNKADSERLNDSAFTTTAESSVVDSDSMKVDESSHYPLLRKALWWIVTA